MKKTSLNLSADPSAAISPLIPLAKTMLVQAKSDPTHFGYPIPRQYTPPTEADRQTEEPERWDGLS